MTPTDDRPKPEDPIQTDTRGQRIARRVTQGLLIVMLLTVPAAIYERQWLTAFLILCILGLCLVPSMFGRRFRVRIPAEFELLTVLFIFASLFLGEIRGYYTRFWWWDIALHTSAGFLLGILGFLLAYVLNGHESIEMHMSPFFVALFAFCFSLAMGALWEIFEFGMDQFFGTFMQKGLVDTMWDLIVDTVGAAVIATSGYFYLKTGKEHFLERWISRFVEANPRLFRSE